jgi:glycosyltransferase involved in cell wall biosynthesis
MEAPLLSVCLITYNHASFITQAIEGVLMQKVNFNWELIIADDFSTDGTREIIIEYKKKYPDFITLILQEKNVGAAQNWMDLITKPISKYIAYFEGDDYWIDPLKLQKQVDFLENNPEYIACCHNVLVKNEIENTEYLMWQWDKNIDFTIEDLALGNKISTLSLVFKNDKDVINKVFDFFTIYPQSPIGDYVLNMFLAEKGKIKYFHGKMGIYRIHTGGIWISKFNNSDFALMKFYESICLINNLIKSIKNEKFKIIYNNFNNQKINLYEKTCKIDIERNKARELKKDSKEMFKLLWYFEGNRFRFMLSCLFRIYLTRMYIRLKK